MSITPDHDKALSYHPLTEGRAEVHETLRAAAKLLAFTAVQESLMWANAAVAIHEPNA
jgi:hypothetical protein